MTTVDQPSQAERLEAVADATTAGPGATDAAVAGDPLTEKSANGASSTSSDPPTEQNSDKKPPEIHQTPGRSKGKVALIMGSLMVRCLFK